MHHIDVRPEIVERVMARRGRYHLFDGLVPRETAFVVIDMINMFLSPGAPAEVPAARGIVESTNRLTAALRPLGALVVWINSPIMSDGKRSGWDGFFNNFVAREMRARTLEASLPGSPGQALWPDLDVHADDLVIPKTRYSALIGGASQLEPVLRSYGIRNVLIGGTKTNVCCESTARDAMMLDFNVVMVRDCLAALSDEEHRSALENVIQQFGDVMTASEALSVLHQGRAANEV